jgi:hypothetical protein
MWSFLGRHLNLLLAILAVSLWGGALGWFLRNDVRNAWRDYRKRQW